MVLSVEFSFTRLCLSFFHDHCKIIENIQAFHGLGCFLSTQDLVHYPFVPIIVGIHALEKKGDCTSF
jgi:hypothetical protein